MTPFFTNLCYMVTVSLIKSCQVMANLMHETIKMSGTDLFRQTFPFHIFSIQQLHGHTIWKRNATVLNGLAKVANSLSYQDVTHVYAL